MTKEHDSKNEKGKGKAPEYNSTDPMTQEAAQAASGSRGSEATTGNPDDARATSQANSQSQAITTGQASNTVQNSATTTTKTKPRMLLPFWSRPHPRFGTAAEPADRFRCERRTWNPVGRPRRAPNWRDRLESDDEDEEEAEKSGQGKGDGSKHGTR